MPWGRGSTRKSRKLRATVLKLQPCCTCTGCPRCTPTGCARPSTDDDHIIPVWQGGTDDPDNHRGLCHPCHDHKSRQEAAQARTRPKRQPKHPGLANALHGVTLEPNGGIGVRVKGWGGPPPTPQGRTPFGIGRASAYEFGGHGCSASFVVSGSAGGDGSTARSAVSGLLLMG